MSNSAKAEEIMDALYLKLPTTIDRWDANRCSLFTWVSITVLSAHWKALRDMRKSQSHLEYRDDLGVKRESGIDWNEILPSLEAEQQTLVQMILEGYRHKEVQKKLGKTSSEYRSVRGRTIRKIRRELQSA